MVPLLDFITTNIHLFISLGLGLLILLVAIFSYQQTRHIGFLLIGIGEFLSIIWVIFYLFVLQGVFLIPNLSSMGFSFSEIGKISAVLGFISLILYI
ncbi:hypothetical protein, partial [Candidatus Hodarchaeum mangrovi]